jgi:hypothetical protein
MDGHFQKDRREALRNTCKTRMTEYDQFIVLNYAQLYQDMFFLSPIEPAMPRISNEKLIEHQYSGGVAASNH